MKNKELIKTRTFIWNSIKLIFLSWLILLVWIIEDNSMKEIIQSVIK